jgi:AAA ATPase domain
VRFAAVRPSAGAIRRRSDVPLVGREAHLQRLVDAFQRAIAERRPQLVTVVGPAGIGKTRLARELVPLIAEDGRALHGRCVSHGEGIAFAPIADIMRQLAAGEPTRAALGRILTAEADRELITDALAVAAGASAKGVEPETLAWSLRKLFETLARERPLLLVFDDLHWAEPVLLDLVEHILDWAADAPILVLALARPELLDARPGWAGGRRDVSSFALDPLSDAEAATLADLLAAGELAPARRSAIVAAASGNPLYLEHLLAISAATGDQSALLVPDTLQSLLAARLDQLEPADARTLEIAAVIGEEFWRSALAQLDDGDASADAALQALIRDELIEPTASAVSGEDALRFRHVLIREAAYERLPKQRRAELHEHLADWLEQRRDALGASHDELAGYHLERAHGYRATLGLLGANAQELAIRAGAALAAAAAHRQQLGDAHAAVNLLTRALNLLPADDARRGELLVRLAGEQIDLGDFRDADATLAAADAIAAETRNEHLAAQISVSRARQRLQAEPTVDTAELEALLRSAIEHLAHLGDDRGLALAWTTLAWLPWIRCNAVETEHALRRGLEHARRAGDEQTETVCLSYLLGTAVVGPLSMPEAITRCERALQHPSKLLHASALRGLAILTAMQGEATHARDLAANSKQILNDLGQLHIAASATSQTANIELLAGRPDLAESELRWAYETLKDMGETSGLSTIAAILAEALLAQGKLDDANRFAEIAEANAAPDDLQTIIPTRRARAHAIAQQGQLDEAEALAHATLELATSTDWLTLTAHTYLTLAHILSLAANHTSAAGAAEQALALYEQKGDIVSAAAARNVITAAAATAQPQHGSKPIGEADNPIGRDAAPRR